jgi:hypothetical protein
VNSANKKLKKKEKADLSLKHEQDKKMMQMQLCRERYISKRDKEKRDAKDASDKMLLDNKKAQTMLTHNLRKQSKDDDLVRRENVKNRKDVKELEDVGVIAAGMRNKQMNINNGQFNAHVSLDTVSFVVEIFRLLICHSPSLLSLQYSATTHWLGPTPPCSHSCSPCHNTTKLQGRYTRISHLPVLQLCGLQNNLR